ncbi:MAG: RIP metalloprotease [Actinobacteria bacterium]|nr:RIP metalloprotease [Actinomycetota bacterium]
MGLIGALAFVVALLLSVMIHEFGHFATARHYGMHVTEFFLGFGKRIWSTKRGETEFGLKAIPAGGYCKISGMSPREEIDSDIEPRAFYKASVPKKLVVLGSGSFLHFVLGIFLLFTLFAAVGTTQVLPKISQVVACVPSGDQCAPTDPISPAKSAGLQVGDEILSINSSSAMSWEEITPVLRANPNREVILRVKRDGVIQTIPITLAQRTVNGEIRGYLGIINQIGQVRKAPTEAFSSTLSLTREMLAGSVRALVGLPSQIPSLFRETFLGETRKADGLIGVVGVARASGQTASSGVLTTGEKIATFLLIIASLNIFVGVFNLLPILPLDGGHMAVALFEGTRRSLARLRGRPDPGPADVEKLTPITFIVVVILIVLSLLLLFADIFNPINLNL